DIVELSFGELPRDELILIVLDRPIVEVGGGGGSIFSEYKRIGEFVLVAMIISVGFSWREEEGAMDRGFTRGVMCLSG
ncbi:MAG TPA: hypothetical protein QF520_00455, partial [SAR202 cluster bacterium]|nr:hypothetical protein [SAR202 cluster bacterium]